MSSIAGRAFTMKRQLPRPVRQIPAKGSSTAGTAKITELSKLPMRAIPSKELEHAS